MRNIEEDLSEMSMGEKVCIITFIVVIIFLCAIVVARTGPL